MLTGIWCLTPLWKRIFMIALLFHGAWNILFFEAYINLWDSNLYPSSFFDRSSFYYFINMLPVLELGSGLLLFFGFIRKKLLVVTFYAFLTGSFYALDNNQVLSFVVFLSMAFFSLLILFGHFYKDCDRED